MNTIIEKIRAEVERRKKQMVDASYPPVIKKTRISELSIVLDILDDIQERTDNPITFTLQEQPVKIDIRKELASIEFMGVNDARDSETIARHFYELGQQSKPKVCEGLEEAAERYEHNRVYQDELDKYANYLDSLEEGETPRMEEPSPETKYLLNADMIESFKAGAKWQKEQMMKDAMEGKVVTTNKYTSVRYLSRYGTFRYFYGIGRGYQKGDKVKLIIIKED